MANSLNRNIKEGEIVVLAKKYIDRNYWDDRRVIVHSGFGMSASTSGTALAVEWLCDGEESRFEGYMIDAEETRILQEEGRFGADIIPDPVSCIECGSLDTERIKYGKNRPIPGFVCNSCGREWKDKS